MLKEMSYAAPPWPKNFARQRRSWLPYPVSDGDTPSKMRNNKSVNGGKNSERPAVPSDFLAPLVSALRDLMTLLRNREIPSVVIGGIAASFLGRPRVTRDIDALILLDGSRLEELVTSAKLHGFAPRLSDAVAFAKANRVLLLRHESSGIDIDIALGALPFEEEVLQRVRPVSLGEVSIPLPSPEDLIIMKAVAHRQRDMADIEGIVAAHPEIDVTRVRQWLTQFAELLDMPEILADVEKIILTIRNK
jgi:hypothetical protein